MSRIIMLIPTNISIGLTSVSLGIARLMKQKGINLTIFKPISQSYSCNKDQIIEVLNSHSNIQIDEPLKMSYVESMLANN
ncbi:MAG: AAA family ATPase, partial [Arsenophonus sp. NC-QC1-MAG3]